MKAYLDSSAVLDLVYEISDRHEAALEVLSGHDREWCVSDLVRMECVVQPLRLKDVAAEGEVRGFIGLVQCLELPSVVFDEAAILRANFGLKTPDAIHLATAMHHGCVEFWTNDQKLSKLDLRITFRSFPEH